MAFSVPDQNHIDWTPRVWYGRTDRFMCSDPTTRPVFRRDGWARLTDSTHGEDGDFAFKSNGKPHRNRCLCRRIFTVEIKMRVAYSYFHSREPQVLEVLVLGIPTLAHSILSIALPPRMAFEWPRMSRNSKPSRVWHGFLLRIFCIAGIDSSS